MDSLLIIGFTLFRMALILHQSGTSHSHSHGLSNYQSPSGDEDSGHSHTHGNTSVRAAFIHAVGDLLQSVGVLLAATVIYFKVTASCRTKSLKGHLKLAMGHFVYHKVGEHLREIKKNRGHRVKVQRALFKELSQFITDKISKDIMAAWHLYFSVLSPESAF